MNFTITDALADDIRGRVAAAPPVYRHAGNLIAAQITQPHPDISRTDAGIALMHAATCLQLMIEQNPHVSAQMVVNILSATGEGLYHAEVPS